MLCWVWGGAGLLGCSPIGGLDNPIGGLDNPKGGLDNPIGGLELAGNSFSALKNSSRTFLKMPTMNVQIWGNCNDSVGKLVVGFKNSSRTFLGHKLK